MVGMDTNVSRRSVVYLCCQQLLEKSRRGDYSGNFNSEVLEVSRAPNSDSLNVFIRYSVSGGSCDAAIILKPNGFYSHEHGIFSERELNRLLGIAHSALPTAGSAASRENAHSLSER